MTVVAIHQPNYLPWAGYFHKMAHCDEFVFLDDAQFTKGGFTNRNRIKTSQGLQWMSIPVHAKLGDPIREITWSAGWQAKHQKTLQAAYGKAPFFQEVMDWFSRAVMECGAGNMGELNIHVLTDLSVRFHLPCSLLCASGMDVPGKGDERLVRIVKRLGGKVYLSGRGGMKYQDVESFGRQGIEVRYQAFTPPEYPQLWGTFEPGLSVIDMLFNCGFEEVARMVTSGPGTMEA